MKILIAGIVMAQEGYEEEQLVKALEKELKKEHTVDTFLLPFTRNFLTLPDQILVYQLLDASDCDMLITVGYPACMIEHSNKVVYLFDAAPHFWEYWDSQYGVLCNNQYLNIRDTVHNIDKKILSTAKKVVCSSNLLAKDLSKRLGIKAETVYCPALEFENSSIAADETEKYIMAETSLLPYQRPETLIKVAKNINEYKMKLFIPNTDIVYMETLKKWIEKENLNERIEIINNPAGNDDYKMASAFICADYNVRRIPNYLIKAVKAGLPIFAAKDCGAEEEILNKYNNKKLFSVDNCENINDKNIADMNKNNARTVKLENISSFAERLVEV